METNSNFGHSAVTVISNSVGEFFSCMHVGPVQGIQSQDADDGASIRRVATLRR